MLMITRTDSLVELGNCERRRLAFDVARLASAAFATERAPCGRVVQVLALVFADGAEPMRIPGSPAELAALHQTVSEIMLETASAQAVH